MRERVAQLEKENAELRACLTAVLHIMDTDVLPQVGVLVFQDYDLLNSSLFNSRTLLNSPKKDTGSASG